MSAFDPTTQPDEVEPRLRSWMADQRANIDLTTTYATIVQKTGSSRQRRRFLYRASVNGTTPPTTWSYGWARVAPIAIAALLLGLAIGAGILVGSGLDLSKPVPSPIASPPALVIDPAVDIERDATQFGTAGVRYTSSRFSPRVTFTLTPRDPTSPTAGDVCLPAATGQRTSATSARAIVLAHPKGCVEDLRFIRPWAVACGSAGDHPDAAALAAAILAIPGESSAMDLGSPDAAGLPTGTFREPYPGRVLRMPGGGPPIDADLADPDDCSLLPEPGSDDPVVEIRHDIAALFVLLDVDGELLVIRASTGGHDGPSHKEAVARGYGAAELARQLHLIGLVRDIRFGP